MITREIYWNVVGKGIFYLLSILAVSFLLYGLWLRLRPIFLGRREEKSKNNLLHRLFDFVQGGFGQVRIMKVPFPGLMHLLLFSGFLILFLGTLYVSGVHWVPSLFHFDS